MMTKDECMKWFNSKLHRGGSRLFHSSEVKELIDDIYFTPCHIPLGATRLWGRLPDKLIMSWFNKMTVDDWCCDEHDCIASQWLARYLLGKDKVM